MATSPAVSGVKEKITRERTISPEELAAEQSKSKTPAFVELIESLTPERWANEDWRLAIVREDPKPSTYGGQNTLEQCQGVLEVRPGVSIPLDDWEAIQLAIKQKYGGKVYRLILKKGRERITEGKCINEAPPKYPETNSGYGNPLPNAPATDASVASKAIDVMAQQQPDAVRLAMDVLRSASEIVMRQANPPAAAVAPPPRDPLVEALLQRALNPPAPPDPFEMFLKFKQLMGDGGMGSTNAIIEKVLGAAVDKIINPAPAVTGRTTLLDIGREFIPVLGTVMHEYRLSREADARITEIQRSAMPAQPVPAVPQQNPPAAIVALPPAAQPTPQQAAPPAAPALTFQQIESHIAKIVKNVEYSVDEAVDKVLEFLYDTDPRIVGALLNPPSLDSRLKPGKDGLMQLFTFEPELKDCITNVPRLSEFLDKFIVAATEAEAAEARLRAAAPANASPQKPA